MKRIVLFGGGNHARYCLDILHQQNKYQIVGIIDQSKPKGEICGDYQVIGTIAELDQLIDHYQIEAGLITIGDNYSRYQVHELIKQVQPNFQFVNAIHPTAIFGKQASIQTGIVVGANSIVGTHAKIGAHCWIGSHTLVEHDNVMHDFSNISSGSITGGFVEIGFCSAITIGAVILDRIQIGEHTVVGAGALVTKNISHNEIWYGTPARFIRNRVENERFLK